MHRILLTLTFIFSICTIGIIAYSCFFALPNVEDLYLSILSRELGVIDFFRIFQTSFTARYSANLFDAINPLVYNNIFSYSHYIFITLFLYALSIFLFSYVFTDFPIWKNIIISLFFLSVFLMSSPSLFFTLYYLTASYVYSYPIILFIFNLFLFNVYSKDSVNSKFFLFILLSISLFFSIGFSELFLPLYLILSVLIIAYYYKFNRIDLKFILPISSIVIISILFFLSSPGTFSRVEEKELQLSSLLINSTTVYLKFLSQYLFTPQLILLFTVSYFLKGKNKINSPVKITLLTVLISYIMTLPFYYSRSNTSSIEERVYIPVIFIIQFALFYFVFPSLWKLITQYTKEKHIKNLAGTSGSIIILLIFFETLYLKNNAVGKLFQEINSGQVKEFYKSTTEEYVKLIAASQSENEFEILCLSNSMKQHTSMFNNIHVRNNRYNSLWNLSLEAYFKINEVRVDSINKHKFSR